MINSKIQKKINSLPTKPGVYLFIGSRGQILYIGKAINLKSRVRSYFFRNLEKLRGPLILNMIPKIKDIKFETADSALEALILESVLIKKHKPWHNTESKDDKSFNYVVITDEDFPRVLIIRGRDLSTSNLKTTPYKLQASFGPFPNGGQLKIALKIIRKIFPFRDKCSPPSMFKKPSKLSKKHSNILQNVGMFRLCFMGQIGLCPGVCSGKISKKDYARNTRHIKLFLSGQKNKLIKNLEKEMSSLAKKHKFELAKIVRDKIFALRHIQDVSLLGRDYSYNFFEHAGSLHNKAHNFRIESYDISHLMGVNVVGVMVVFENGNPKKSEYRKFKIKVSPGIDDTRALKEILERRLNHTEWQYPNLIVVDGGVSQFKAFKKITDSKKLHIDIVAVTKDEKHRPKKILGNEKIIEKNMEVILKSNLEAHRFAITYHRKLRDKI